MSEVHKRWIEEKRSPLIDLTPKEKLLYQKFLDKFSIKQSEITVAIHLRDPFYYNEPVHGYQSFRLTNINDFSLLFEWLAKENITTFLFYNTPNIAESLEISAEAKKKIIQVPNDGQERDELHLSIVANAHLFIDGCSGLRTVASAFGVKSVYTNMFIREGLPWGDNSYYAPKLYYSLAEHRILSFEEIVQSGLKYSDHGLLLEHYGISLLNLTTDDHLEVVREALMGDNYPLSKDTYVVEKRTELKKIKKLTKTNSSIKISSHILKKYGSYWVN